MANIHYESVILKLIHLKMLLWNATSRSLLLLVLFMPHSLFFLLKELREFISQTEGSCIAEEESSKQQQIM